MKFIKCMTVTGLFLALPLFVGAADDGKPAPEKQKPTAVTTVANMKKTIYKPPLRGAPAGRVGGGTRGAGERESFSLLVLAPDHVGYTTDTQPCLYWFISRTTSYPVELTITEKRGVTPLVQKVIKTPENPGIQAVCLADLGVKLRKNVQYNWFVSLLTDAERSRDILAGGILENIDPPATVAGKLATADSSALPMVYAEEGLWYDALEALSRSIALSPNNVELRRQRAFLLDQVGLSAAAVFETKDQPVP